MNEPVRAVEQTGPGRVIKPALEYLIRLEAYFRVHGLDRLSDGIDRVLVEAEDMLNESLSEPWGDSAGAQPQADQDLSPCTAGSTPETRDRAIPG